MPRFNAVLRFGKAGERLVPVKLGAKLTEVGTLEIWAESKDSEHRWRLQFELRKSRERSKLCAPAAVISDEALRSAEALIPRAFSSKEMPPEQLPARLEQTLGLGRNSWPRFGDPQAGRPHAGAGRGRQASAAHELRWLNLCGFCLRPGFGFPGDDFRIEQARRVYASGLHFANQMQNEIEWWIFWGRVAGGLNKNQQTDVFQRLSPTLLPRASQNAARVNPSLLREMWRAAASLELLPIQTKTQLGDELMTRIRQGRLHRHGPVVHRAPGSSETFLRPHQPGSTARDGRALGGATPEDSKGERCDRRSRAANGRRHARPAAASTLERGSPGIPRSRAGSRTAGSFGRHGSHLRRGSALRSRFP